jgi:hypothetical protein
MKLFSDFFGQHGLGKEPGPDTGLDTLLMSGVKPISDYEPEEEYSGGSMTFFLPVPYGTTAKYLTLGLSRLWHKVKIDSGIGLPMVNVLGVDAGVDIRRCYM